MCFGPSTLGAGAKTRLESRIKKFTPHCVCRWAKHAPMDDEEMLFKQVQMTTNATKGAAVWVYRNTVYGAQCARRWDNMLVGKLRCAVGAREKILYSALLNCSNIATYCPTAPLKDSLKCAAWQCWVLCVPGWQSPGACGDVFVLRAVCWLVS